jgi:SAM-dependent methyltransferase
MRNAAYFVSGLALGAANTLRHRVRGYTTPRPFDPGAVDETLSHVNHVVNRLEARGSIDWRGLRVLELGPGSDLATGVLMLHRGARSYLAVDAFDNRHQASPMLYSALMESLGAEIPLERVEFQLASFPALPELRGPFDLVVSNATLEHIDRIPDLFARLRAVVAPGGRMVHHIDGQTHMRWLKDHDPLNILRYGDTVYDRVLAFPGAPNRLRCDDYVQAAKTSGWSSASIVRGRDAPAGYLARTQPALARRFRARSDLDALTFTLVADA